MQKLKEKTDLSDGLHRGKPAVTMNEDKIKQVDALITAKSFMKHIKVLAV